MIRVIRQCGWCAGLLCLASVASAQNYPAKTIRLVLPVAPGGGADVIARFIQSEMVKWAKVVKSSGATAE